MLEEKVKVAEEEAQLLARKSREAEEEIRRARESAVKVITISHTQFFNIIVNLLIIRVKKRSWQWRREYFLQKRKLVRFHRHLKRG